MRRKSRCVGGSWLFIVTHFVATVRIYRKDLTRVTVSHNRLGLSLPKRIRHGLIAKINGKRRSWNYEALGRISTGVHPSPSSWILANYSRACVPITIAMSRLVR
jgi:hypothetical protein